MGNRTTSIKNLDELYLYGVTESSSLHFATIIVTAAGSLEVRQKAAFDLTNTQGMVVFPKYGMAAASGTISAGATGSFAFAASVPPNQGVLDASPGTGTSEYFTIAGGTAGDVFEAYLVPTYTSSNELSWIDDFSGPAVPGKRNEMLRGSTDHKKRIFNVEKTFSITQRYSNSMANLLSLSGNDYTFITERQDDDAGITSETMFMFGAYHDAGLPTGSTGDNDDTVSLEGSYSDFCFVNGDGN